MTCPYRLMCNARSFIGIIALCQCLSLGDSSYQTIPETSTVARKTAPHCPLQNRSRMIGLILDSSTLCFSSTVSVRSTTSGVEA